MKPKFRNLAAAFAPLSRTSLIVVASLCAAASANADQTWTGASDALWTTAGNWSGAAAPGASDLAIFDVASTLNLATTLGADRTVLGVKVVSPTGAVSVATGNTLTIGASGVDSSAATQSLTLTAPVALGANQIWNVASGQNVTSSGGISGAFSLTKSGAGGLILGNTANAFSGGATVSAGTVTIGSGTVGSAGNLGLAGSTITMAGGTITNGTGGSNGSIGLNNNFVVNSDSIINMGNRMTFGNATTLRTVTGAAKLTLNLNTTISRDDIYSDFGSFTGTLSFTGSGNARLFINGGLFDNGLPLAVLDVNGSANMAPQTNSTGNTIPIGALTGSSATASLGGGSAGSPNYSVGALGTDTTFAGGVRGNAILTKVGSGTLTLTNTTLLDATGATNVNEGTLKVNGTKTGTGATTVNTGATLAGTGTLSATTTIASGGTLAPGDGGIGNITFASLSLPAGSILKVDLASPSSLDTATVSTGGTLTVGSGATVDVQNFNTPGVYPIINTTGATISGTPSAAMSVINGDSGVAYAFSSDASGVKLTISLSDPSNYWNVDGSGSWNTAANWTKGTVPNAAEAIAKIGPGVGGAGGGFSPSSFNIDLDAVQTAGELVLNDDFGCSVTIASGTSGSLVMDNGAASSNIVVTKGNHFITAPVAVDADDVTVDVDTGFTLNVSGVVSGTGASLSKSGPGTLSLAAANTFDGGVFVSGGVLKVSDPTNLGDAASATTFLGGTLQINNNFAADARSYKVFGASNAIFDTNGFNHELSTGVSPASGGTGGLTKAGVGTLSLLSANTYTGATVVNSGLLDVPIGGSVNAGTTTINTGSSKLQVSGGSYTSAGTSGIAGASAGIAVTAGSASFGGINANTTNASSNIFINLTGGTFSSGFLSMGRCVNLITTPTEGSTTAGLYINGCSASIPGALTMGTGSATNSSVSTRIDSGSLTVGGATVLQINSPDRWVVFDVNGGTFTSTHVATGVQIGSGQTGSNAFLVRAGTATVDRFFLTQPAASTRTSLLQLSGGSLYVGAGGIVGNNNAGTGILDIQLGAVSPATATLGASADWTTLMGATLVTGTATTIKAADSAGAAHNITISGIVSGSGDVVKTGAGTLTLGGANTFTGAVAVSAGTLAVTGNSSAATGAVSVASGATLSGNGNIGGNVTIASGAHHSLAIAAAPGSQVTRTITGTLTLDSGNILDLTAASAPTGGVYVLATVTGGITGTPTTINYPSGVTGTLAINGNNLELTVVAGYSSWAATHAGSGEASADFDNDGVSNGVEYFMNSAAGFTANPGLVSGTVTWPNGGNINSADYGTQFVVQTSPDLMTWTNVLAGDSHLSNTAGSVSYTVTGAGSRFVRLKVTPN